jgi:hypothetical protein
MTFGKHERTPSARRDLTVCYEKMDAQRLKEQKRLVKDGTPTALTPD